MSDIIIAFDILKNILLSTQNRFDITVMFSPKLATVNVQLEGGGRELLELHAPYQSNLYFMYIEYTYKIMFEQKIEIIK